MLQIIFEKKEMWHRYLRKSEFRHQNWIRTKKISGSCLSTESIKTQNTLGVVMLDFVNSRSQILNLRLVFGGHGHEDKVE